MEGPVRNRVFFNERGRFLLMAKYYPGDYISPELAGMVYKRYPGYTIKVVTEITDGRKSSYVVNIRNSTSIKNLSITDGKIELRDELINGDPNAN
jgi:ribosomal protein L21E